GGNMPKFEQHPLAQLRADRGITQARLSEIAGVSTGSIARIESGARVLQSHHVLTKLSTALGVPVEEFVVPGQAGVDERTIAANYLRISTAELDELRDEIAKAAA